MKKNFLFLLSLSSLLAVPYTFAQNQTPPLATDICEYIPTAPNPDPSPALNDAYTDITESCGNGGLHFTITSCPNTSKDPKINDQKEAKANRVLCIKKIKRDCAQNLYNEKYKNISVQGMNAQQTEAAIQKLKGNITPIQNTRTALEAYKKNLDDLQTNLEDAKKNENDSLIQEWTRKIDTLQQQVISGNYGITKKKDVTSENLQTKIQKLTDDIKAIQDQIDPLRKELSTKKDDIENKEGTCLKAANSENMSATLAQIGQTTNQFKVDNILRVGNETKLTLLNTNPITGQKSVLEKVIQTIAQVLGTLGILLIIISGVIMIVSEGDDNRLTKAKKLFFFTIVGLLIAFSSYIFVEFIISFLFMSAPQ